MAEESHVHDIIIVGAGPCGLAVAARLHEPTPSALFTDTEHNRFYRRYPSKPTLHHRTGRYSKGSCRENSPELRSRQWKSPYDMLVLDSTSDHWMGTWNRNFEALQISHLRSPLFFHPDPRDRDGLLAFAYSQGKMRDLEELTGVVGKELSKHKRKVKAMGSGKKQADVVLDERDRHDYFTPSRPLFKKYCTHIIDRYSIEDIVIQTKLESLQYGYVDHISTDKIFTLKTSTGTRHAKIVILAIGAPHLPIIPRDSPLNGFPRGSACHSSHIPTCGLLPTHVKAKIKERKSTSVVVVGGGLTSAQIADACITHGVKRVFLVMRSEVKVKHFDVELGWVAKFRNTLMSTFWMAENDDERLAMVKQARNGGSMTPKFRRILQTHELHGRVSLHPFTKITESIWDASTNTWNLETTPAIEGLPPIDHVIYATGAQPDITKMPMLEQMMSEWPVEVKGGMPCLTDDLMWSEDVPCLMTGRLAALRLGPGAGNLEGARLGAERIAWKVEELIQQGKPTGEGKGREDDERCFHSGIGNQFGILEALE